MFDAFLKLQEDAGGTELPETDDVSRLLGPLLAATRRRISRGQETGQIDAAIDPAIAVELLLGPMFHRWLPRTAPLDDAYAHALATHVVRALRPVDHHA